MKTENSVLMQRARESLKDKWPLAIGTYLVYTIILICLNQAYLLLVLLLSGPLALGLTTFSLSFSRNTNPKFSQIFSGFNKFAKALETYIWMYLFIFLWLLLLIIPGIIASIAYSMTFFILADNPTVSGRDAIKKSKMMMNGNKWKFFKLNLRFIGWIILAILSFGIGFLWLIQYCT